MYRANGRALARILILGSGLVAAACGADEESSPDVVDGVGGGGIVMEDAAAAGHLAIDNNQLLNLAAGSNPAVAGLAGIRLIATASADVAGNVMDGFARDAVVDVEAMKKRVLADLEKTGVTKGHRLVADHHVVMDPAYVHITQRSMAEHARLAGDLRSRGVYPVGRYGGWTYCSIEDNIVEARALVASFG